VLYTDGDGRANFGIRGSSSEYADVPEVIEAGKWTHLAGTYDGTTIKIYVNGKLAATNNEAGLSLQNNATVYLADQADRTTYDDFWIFSRALSASEVFALYNNGMRCQ
jgi:hypothetical protein